MGNKSSHRRSLQGSTYSKNSQFTSDPHVSLSQSKSDNFSPSSRRQNLQRSKISGNRQFIPEPDAQPSMPQTARLRFPELVGLTTAEAKRRIIQMGLQPKIIAPGQPVSHDLNENRVCLTVSKYGYVIRPSPMRG